MGLYPIGVIDGKFIVYVPHSYSMEFPKLTGEVKSQQLSVISYLLTNMKKELKQIKNKIVSL